MNQDQLINLLNELVERNKDSAKAFLRAERDVASRELSTYFEKLAVERAELVEDIERHVIQLGGEPQDSSTTGGVKRGWMKIKAAMTIEHEKTDAVVLSDLAEYEAKLVDHYKQLLGKDLPADLKSYLRNQHGDISRTQEELAEMKQETASRTE